MSSFQVIFGNKERKEEEEKVRALFLFQAVNEVSVVKSLRVKLFQSCLACVNSFSVIFSNREKKEKESKITTITSFVQ